jgi:excisionase family DNA binding protein
MKKQKKHTEPIENGKLVSPDEWLIPFDAAKLLEVSLQTIYLYIKHGLIKAVKWRGTRWHVSLADIERMQKGEIDVSGIYKGWRDPKKGKKAK